MARTGRPPKPLQLRILEGNPGKRKMPKDIPQPIKMFDAPDPPERLGEIAREHWIYLAQRLQICGILTEIDVFALEHCCTALAIAQNASKNIDEDGSVLVLVNSDGSYNSAIKSPYMAIYTEALTLFEKYGSKLGLSPIDRMRLKGVGTGEKQNPLEEYLSAKAK